MKFYPRRARGLIVGGLLLGLVSGLILFGVYRLGTTALSPWTVLWAVVPLVAAPLAAAIAYRLYGLLSASYSVDRNGLVLRWGLRLEQIPLTSVRRLQSAASLSPGVRPAPGLWWPGCVVGEREVEGVGRIEFMASESAPGQIVVITREFQLAISPANAQAFQQAYVAGARMGSLEPLAPLSIRPDFLVARVWSDRVARALLLAGLTLPLVLLGYLAFRAPSLPQSVPFGFDVRGVPALFAPPGRLLLLPMVGIVCWMIDAVLGAWLLRRETRPHLSYALWSTAIAVGGMLWAAVAFLLGAA
ncbi:MAG: PH domain-containing protein [Anaerolineales bacterium]|nr:PH domain-containing protein [Anaerolineales bacterium]